MRALLTLVERDFGRYGPLVRERWDAFERALANEAVEVEAAAVAQRQRGEYAVAAASLTAFMARAVDALVARAAALRREISA
jgi:hypothetical protein